MFVISSSFFIFVFGGTILSNDIPFVVTTNGMSFERVHIINQPTDLLNL